MSTILPHMCRLGANLGYTLKRTARGSQEKLCWRVSGTPANFNGFRILEALLYGTLVVGVSQTLRR